MKKTQNMKVIIELIFNISILTNALMFLNFIFKWIEIPGYLWGLTLLIGAVLFLFRAYYFNISEKS
jgi:hypothetical protein